MIDREDVIERDAVRLLAGAVLERARRDAAGRGDYLARDCPGGVAGDAHRWAAEAGLSFRWWCDAAGLFWRDVQADVLRRARR
jgi:hypothetical protein